MNYAQMKTYELDSVCGHFFDKLHELNKEDTDTVIAEAGEILDAIKDIYTIKAMMKECGETAMYKANGHAMANTPHEHMQVSASSESNGSLFRRHHVES